MESSPEFQQKIAHIQTILGSKTNLVATIPQAVTEEVPECVGPQSPRVIDLRGEPSPVQNYQKHVHSLYTMKIKEKEQGPAKNKKKQSLIESIRSKQQALVANVIEIKETTDEAVGTTEVRSCEPSDIEEETETVVRGPHSKAAHNAFIKQKRLL